MDWRELAEQQDGVIARRQLRAAGVDADRVRNHVLAGRWTRLSPTVVATTTGPLSAPQLRWLAVLHPSETGLVAGFSSAGDHGLARWHRDELQVLLSRTAHVPGPIDGITYSRTRRDLDRLRSGRPGPPTVRLESAVLLQAAAERSPRTAQGLLAACVQQRLTTAEKLLDELTALQPLRRGVLLRDVLSEIAGGADSLAEVDLVRVCDEFGLARPRRQTRRTDRAGRDRRTDAEWDLPGGRVLVLEVEGPVHLEAERWADDVRRQRQLSSPDRTVLRCTSTELRDEPDELVADLLAHGVPRSAPSRRAPARPHGADPADPHVA